MPNCYYQNSYTAQCEICDEGYALDEHKLVCSRIIPNCKSYETAFECKKCEKGYILDIDLTFGQRRVNCVQEPNNIANCKKEGSVTFLQFPLLIETSITGCIKCKNSYSTGNQCVDYSTDAQLNCKE